MLKMAKKSEAKKRQAKFRVAITKWVNLTRSFASRINASLLILQNKLRIYEKETKSRLDSKSKNWFLI